MQISNNLRYIFWNAIDRFSIQGAQFITNIILARLILPQEYGLIAMITIFIAIAQSFVDSGFFCALVQKKNTTDEDFSTVFIFNFIISLLFYLILFIFAPYIADFYNEEKLLLITRYIGINIIITSFFIVPKAKLSIALKFKAQAKISFSSILISSIISIYLAYHNWGVWALVVQNIGNNLCMVIFYFVAVKWYPKLRFSKQSFKQLFGFGSKLLMAGMLNTIYANIYTLIIGKFFGSTDVGLFNRASNFAQFPSSNISGIIGSATYPVQCQLKENESLLNQHFIKTLKFAAFITLPACICLAVLSKPFLQCILNENWISASPYLSILSIAYMFVPIQTLNWQYLNVKGRTDLSLRAELYKKFFAILYIIISIPFGMIALSVSILVYSLTDIYIIVNYVKKISTITHKLEITHLLPTLIISILAGFITFSTFYLFKDEWAQLLGGGCIFLTSYCILCHIGHLEEYEKVKQYINSIRKHSANTNS